MKHRATELLDSDLHLRFVLVGLECALDVEFNPSAIEQVFAGAEENSVLAKKYSFWSAPGVRVTGYVEEHEPETLWLTVESQRAVQPPLSAIAQRAKHLIYRMTRE